jgi:hypothetical protein
MGDHEHSGHRLTAPSVYTDPGLDVRVKCQCKDVVPPVMICYPTTRLGQAKSSGASVSTETNSKQTVRVMALLQADKWVRI